MAETYKHFKRHQGRPKERKGQILIYKGSIYSLIGKINRSETLVKA